MAIPDQASDRIDPSARMKHVRTSTSKEPMVLTLLDLSRHTDKELAAKAGKIINERVSVAAVLAESFLAGRKNARNEAETVLQRMERDRAERTAKDLIANGEIKANEKEFLKRLLNDAMSADKSIVLRPTGSLQGDRYYVQAEWDPRDEKATSCLTQLFNRATINARSLEDEKKLMKEKNKRWIYWYSKEWALSMAGRIKECGGRASFVAFYF